MGQTLRSQETLRKLAMIDEGFVEDQAGLGLDPAGPTAIPCGTAADVALDGSIHHAAAALPSFAHMCGRADS